jgi:hypothetical protein
MTGLRKVMIEIVVHDKVSAREVMGEPDDALYNYYVRCRLVGEMTEPYEDEKAVKG